MFHSSEVSGIIFNMINRLIQAKIWCALSNLYLKMTLEHSTLDYTNDPLKDTSIDGIVLKFVAMIGG